MQQIISFFDEIQPDIQQYKQHITFLQYLYIIPKILKNKIQVRLLSEPRNSLEARAFAQLIYLLKLDDLQSVQKAINYNNQAKLNDFKKIPISVNITPIQQQKHLFNSVMYVLLAQNQPYLEGIESFNQAIKYGKKAHSMNIIPQLLFNLSSFQIKHCKPQQAKNTLLILGQMDLPVSLKKRCTLSQELLDYEGFITFLSKTRQQQANQLSFSGLKSQILRHEFQEIMKSRSNNYSPPINQQPLSASYNPQIFKQQLSPKRRHVIIKEDDNKLNFTEIAKEFDMSREQMKNIIIKTKQSGLQFSLLSNTKFTYTDFADSIFDSRIDLTEMPTINITHHDELSIIGQKHVNCSFQTQNRSGSCRQQRTHSDKQFQQEINDLL